MVVTTFETPVSGDLDYFRHSKIALPVSRLMSRPRLVTAIDEGVRGKLTVLGAPAGWGKSTALGEWSGSTELHVAWLCLDHEDNAPHRFLHGLVSSIDRIAPESLADVRVMLRSPQPVSLARFSGHVVRQLDDVDGEIAIVLDHYETIHNGDIHDVVRSLIDMMPSHVHVVIATRGHLPIPLGRLRAEGELVTIGVPELRLTVDEARQALAEHDGVRLSDADLETLVERTEGWVAGLRLAARSLAGRRDPRTAIARFRGTHQDIADYLAEEVVRKLPPDQQAFLLETSVLEVLTAGVSAAVTGRDDAAAMLQETARADLFLLPLDEERVSYRYHGLFRDLLLAELERQRPGAAVELNRRAALWYERNHMLAEAVTYGFRADDSPLVIGLLERAIETLIFECAETDQVVRWIEQLPRDAVFDHGRLAYWYAWTLTLTGRLDQAEYMLEQLERRGEVDPARAGGLAGGDSAEVSIAAIRARIAAYRGDHHATIAQAKRALDTLQPPASDRITAEVMSSLGFAHRALGQAERAAEAFAEAARLGRASDHASAARWGTRYLVVTRIEQGRLREAEALLEEDLERVRQDPRDPGSTLAALHVGRAEVLTEQNRLAEARDALTPAIPLIQRVGDAKMLMNAYVAEARLLQAKGRLAEARERQRRAEDIFPGPNRGAGSAWLALIQGDTEAALRWARASGFSLDDPADPGRDEQHQILFARIMSRTAPSPEAHALLERLLAAAEAERRTGRCIELLNILAVVDCQRGDREHARAHLIRSLELARFEGFVRVFVHEGQELAAILRELVRERGAIDEDVRTYAVELLRAFGGVTADAGGHPNGGLVEALTDRQVEILTLIAEGHSNREIARDLFIAEGTVKAHVHQVFGKLMARNRTEAVARARELDLLPQ